MTANRKPSAKRVATAVTAKHPTGVRTIEQLNHFQCGECRKWWSIGDAPVRANWFCPWCGRENRFD